MKRKRFIGALLTSLLIFSVMFTGCSQSATNDAGGDQSAAWPAKPINLIVPASAGGGTDMNARLLAKYLTEKLGQSVTVTNVAGSSGALGLKEGKDADPDGYTFVYFNEETVTNEVLGVMDFGYKDFKMVGNVFEVPMFLVGSSDIPDIATLTKLAKEKPGQIVFGAESGAFISILPHIMNAELGIDLKVVDGGQMNERVPLMVGNQINLTFAPMKPVQDYVKTGQLSMVALFKDQRMDSLKDIPTATEQGLDIVYNRFQCIIGPKDVDDAIVAKFSKALEEVSKDPKFIKDAEAQSISVAYTDGNGLLKLMEGYHADLQEFIKLVPKK